VGADLQRRWSRPTAGRIPDSSVVLTNCKIVQGPNIADHAMAMLLALTRAELSSPIRARRNGTARVMTSGSCRT